MNRDRRIPVPAWALAASLAGLAAPGAMAFDLNASLQALQQKAKDARDKVKNQAGAAVGNANNAAPEAAPPPAPSGAPIQSDVANADLVSDQMLWRIEGCGRTQTQEVTCVVSVASQTGDRRISLNTAYYGDARFPDVRLIDSNGNEYRAAAGGFGINETPTPLILNSTATRASFRFKGVDPSATSVARFTVQHRESRESITWSNIPFGKVDRAAMPQAAPVQAAAAAPPPAAGPSPTRLLQQLSALQAPRPQATPAAPATVAAPAAPTLPAAPAPVRPAVGIPPAAAPAAHPTTVAANVPAPRPPAAAAAPAPAHPAAMPVHAPQPAASRPQR